MSASTVAQLATFSKWGLLGALAMPGYPVRALDGVQFTERIRSEVNTRVATATSHRLVARDARFTVHVRGDSVMVSADSLVLSELVDGEQRALDTDGFVGGRYHLRIDSVGRAHLLERPFVPDDLIEVSDLSRAMDDFFPPLPPVLAPGGEGTDSTGRRWHRLTDSAGVQRFRWTAEREHDGTRHVADSVQTQVSESVHETSTLSWSPLRGPMRWSRRIESELTSRLRGQTIRASVVQRIDVNRTP
ncbi:MAG: hypothetical protein V4503_02620 [Gemmatimonadota bacterium]